MERENSAKAYETIDLDSINIVISSDDNENGDNIKKNGDNVKGTANRIDYTQLFTTTHSFESKDALVKHCRSIGKKVNMSLMLCTSRTSKTTEVVVFYIFCERSGAYRPINFKKERACSTKKCQCPFKLKATGTRDGIWEYVVVQGRHNYDLPLYPEGHTLGKFEEAENTICSELTKSFVPPNDILRILKNVDLENSSIIKHVNNARQKFRTEEMEGRRPIQQFQKFLHENGYYQFFRKVEGSDTLSDIFFLHPESYKMMNAWPHVIALDCTYKTNRYGLPLLEVVGFTPTWLLITIAYCFMSSEKEETFVWAMKNLRSFFISEVRSAIPTNRELGLINVVGHIFPKSKHMLCRRHIEMAIKSKAIKLSGGLEPFAKAFVWKWNDAISSHNKDEWTSKWQKMEEYYARYPALVAYVKDTWLIPYEEKIVSVWVDNYNHFGTYTTNRVESEHHRVKREVKSHVATFDTIFRRLHKVMLLQIDEIKSSLEKSRTSKMIEFPSLFDDIACQVSHMALKLMNKELQRNEEKVQGAIKVCGCYFQRTHGLPCAHKLGQYVIFEERVPLTAIHSFWKKLDIELHADNVDYDDGTYAKTWSDLMSAPLPIKKRLLQNIREGLYPDNVEIREPDIINSRGRPKKKQNARNSCEWEYTEKKHGISSSDCPTKKGKKRSLARSTYITSIQANPPKSPVVNLGCGKWEPIATFTYGNDLPPFIIPWLQDFCDVHRDENCGYRAVAFHLWGDEERWLQVREDCWSELSSRRDLYSRIFGNGNHVDTILENITWKSSTAPPDKWMTLPEVGHVIATTYDIVFVSYGIHGGYTFLPLVVDEGVPNPTQIMVVGFISQIDHFEALRMFDDNDYPMPNMAWYWEAENDPRASHLIIPYRKRIENYRREMNAARGVDSRSHVIINRKRIENYRREMNAARGVDSRSHVIIND